MRMRARHFRKLRQKSKKYLVLHTDGLFGDFKDHFKEDRGLGCFTEVLARDEQEAVKRFAKRKHIGIEGEIEWAGERWGKFKVLPSDAPYQRNATYWR